MLPVLFRLGPFTLYSFSVMLCLGFLLGFFVIWKKTREEHYEEADVADALLISCLWGLVGARLFYGLVNLENFGANVLDWLNIFGKPGFSFLGGLVGGGLSLWREAHVRRWDFYEFADYTVMGVVLASIFGWLGSFLNGSNFGLATESIVGVRFIGMFDKRHPVQLYALAFHILFLMYLFWVEGKYRTFEWYRAGKSGARAGFLVFNYILFLGLLGILISWFSPPAVMIYRMNLDWYVWGIIALLGFAGLYSRSGRELSKDFSGLSLGKRRERIEKRRDRRQQL